MTRWLGAKKEGFKQISKGMARWEFIYDRAARFRVSFFRTEAQKCNHWAIEGLPMTWLHMFPRLASIAYKVNYWVGLKSI